MLSCAALASNPGMSSIRGSCDAISNTSSLLSLGTVPFECQLTTFDILANALSCNATVADLNGAVAAFTSGTPFNGVQYQTALGGRVQITRLPSVVFKQSNLRTTFSMTVVYTTNFNGNVSLIVVVPNALSNVITGTNSPPRNLPASGTISIDVELGSWTSDGTIPIQVYVSTGLWPERFGEAGTGTILVVNEHVTLLSSPTHVESPVDGSAAFPISISYVSGRSSVDIAVSVLNANDPRNFLYELSSPGLVWSLGVLRGGPPTATNLTITVRLQSSVISSARYYIQVELRDPSSPSPAIATSVVQPLAVTSLLETVNVTQLPADLAKRPGTSVVLGLSIAYSTSRSAIRVIVLVRSIEHPGRRYVRDATLRGTSALPIGLPASHTSLDLDVLLGSWTTPGNYTAQIVLLSGTDWSTRFVYSPVRTFQVTEESVSLSIVSQQIAAPNTRVVIDVQYTAVGPVTFVPIVRNFNTSFKYLRSFHVVSSSPSMARLVLELGSWATIGPAYSVEVVLLRAGSGWASRFARTPRHEFEITARSNAFAGSISDAPRTPDTGDAAGSGGTPSSLVALSVVAVLCVFVAFGTAVTWRRTRISPTQVKRCNSEPHSEPTEAPSGLFVTETGL